MYAEFCMNEVTGMDRRIQLRNIKQELCRKHHLAEMESGAEIVEDELNREESKSLQKESVASRLQCAEIIVAGGYGVGSEQNFQLLYKLADVLHGQVGATRAAIDAGFCQRGIMIGSTGITVHPRLYIACGISGAIQHTAGIKDCEKLISINIDADAPINKIADEFIHGRVEDVLPQLISDYQRLL